MRFERWKHVLLAASVAAFGAFGCDDDGGENVEMDMVGDTSGDTTTDTGGDTGGDTTTDTGGDTTTDTGGDTATDTGGDTVTDTGGDTVGDTTDTTGDTTADTTDTTGDTTIDIEPDVPVCVPTGAEVSWEACMDGVDNDCDEAIDTDEGCMVCPPTADRTADEAGACDDGIDNDCDGFLDCRDFDCDATQCPDENTDALCSDMIDNDGDRRVDCLGFSCSQGDMVTVCDAATAGPENDATTCGDGLDNEPDGFVDCSDSDCVGIGFCAPTGQTEADIGCDDGLDNDGDARVDCFDSDCAEDAFCMGEDTDAACADGMDNDHDTLIDCADDSCYANPAVTVCYDATEDCTAAGDEDFDGLDTCFDPNCETVCMALPCAADNPIGTCTDPAETCTTEGMCVLAGITPDTAGQLVITEFMQNPNTIPDNEGEWFEVLNPSLTDRYDLDGCVIDSGAGQSHTIAGSLIVGPGEYATFAISANAGFTADLIYDASFSLGNSADTITLTCGGVVIDTVAYDGGPEFPDGNGASASLSPLALDATSNDTGSNWCLTATASYDPNNLGTPGALNEVCPVIP